MGNAEHAALFARLVKVEDAIKANAISAEANKKEHDADQRLLDRVKTAERWMILLTALIFCVSAFQAYESWANNKSTGYQVDQLIATSKYGVHASQQNSKSASDFAISARSINNGVSDAVDMLNIQARAVEATRESSVEESEKALSASITASDKSLQATIDNFRKNQRAWVGPELDGSIFKVEIGKLISYEVNWKNFGISPALHVKWHTRTRLGPSSQVNWQTIQSETNSLNDIPTPMEFTIFNGQQLPNPGYNEMATSEVNHRLSSGQDILILEGIVRYKDTFRDDHATSFCIFYTPSDPGSPSGWITCPIIPIAE